MDINATIDVIVKMILVGAFGMMWYDVRSIRKDMSKYVKLDDCIDKRGTCGSMREAVFEIVQNHSDSLQSMQDLFRTQTECLARLDEKVKALKEKWEELSYASRQIEGDAVYRHRRSTDVS